MAMWGVPRVVQAFVCHARTMPRQADDVESGRKRALRKKVRPSSGDEDEEMV